MSYYHCRNGHHEPDCNGYIGPLDGYTCLCLCHGEWDEQGRRQGQDATKGDPSL